MEKLKKQSHGQAELTHRALDSPRTTVSASFVPPEGNTYIRRNSRAAIILYDNNPNRTDSIARRSRIRPIYVIRGHVMLRYLELSFQIKNIITLYNSRIIVFYYIIIIVYYYIYYYIFFIILLYIFYYIIFLLYYYFYYIIFLYYIIIFIIL